LLIEDAELPGFLKGRQHVDFRDHSSYQQNVDRLVWPGISGKKVAWVGMNKHSDDHFHWPNLNVIAKRRGIETHNLNRDYRAVEEILDALEKWLPHRGCGRYLRRVAGTATRGGRPEFYVEKMFEIRARTKDTREEVVFLLYQNPEALAKGPHHLPTKTVDL
jgi:hypothetical protein